MTVGDVFVHPKSGSVGLCIGVNDDQFLVAYLDGRKGLLSKDDGVTFITGRSAQRVARMFSAAVCHDE